jgi:hypothetical protein
MSVGCAARHDQHEWSTPLGKPPAASEDISAQRDARGNAMLRSVRRGASTMRRLMLKSLTPITVTFSLLFASPVDAREQIEAQSQDRSVVQRRPPGGSQARARGVAFARTALYFGTAKPEGAVTEDEFRQFLNEEVTPLFADGLTLLKGDGQFKGADGLTVKEDSYVLILLYPANSHSESSRSINLIRTHYMEKYQQESVLRVDYPLLVWVSF